ncbi:uncharacterized protein [Ptychodera flava]|uniref:uncharacterized protein n=1 Tax=Ptychodera flava TaxID=63121 RepID=UPI00396A4D01
MKWIEKAFYNSIITRSMSQRLMAIITDLHPDLMGSEISHGSIIFLMTCKSLEAADALWDAYQRGWLDTLTMNTMITNEILVEIDAYFLSLEAVIQCKEYNLCRQELIGKAYHSPGSNSAEKMQSIPVLSRMVRNTREDIASQKIKVGFRKEQNREKARLRNIGKGSMIRLRTETQYERDLMEDIINVKQWRSKQLAKNRKLKLMVESVIDDANIPEELKEVLHQIKRVQTGTPAKNTIRDYQDVQSNLVRCIIQTGWQ